MMVDEGLLKGMKFIAVLKSFDSSYFRAFCLVREYKARPHRLSIQYNGACATYTVLASHMRSGERAIFPDRVCQSSAVFN
jgi:hypothetical protein